MPETCSLDIAERQDELTFAEIGTALHVSKQRGEQLVRETLKLSIVVRKFARIAG